MTPVTPKNISEADIALLLGAMKQFDDDKMDFQRLATDLGLKKNPTSIRWSRLKERIDQVEPVVDVKADNGDALTGAQGLASSKHRGLNTTKIASKQRRAAIAEAMARAEGEAAIENEEDLQAEPRHTNTTKRSSRKRRSRGSKKSPAEAGETIGAEEESGAISRRSSTPKKTSEIQSELPTRETSATATGRAELELLSISNDAGTTKKSVKMQPRVRKLDDAKAKVATKAEEVVEENDN